MNGLPLSLAGADLVALSSGALWWPARHLFCVSDLHLGKSQRMARRGSGPVPPYDTADTLARLAAELQQCAARTVVCLGDSFDDPQAARALPETARLCIAGLQAGRRWIWIEGNHDPGPLNLGGSHLTALTVGPLSFRHIADPGETAEISGHYHPKAMLRSHGRSMARPAFLADRDRIILPAFGTYTGGLRSDAPVLDRLMRPDALAYLTGTTVHAIPMPRQRPGRGSC
ncbi:ligase-associated DNA damage response endonuclease PdeM [Sedimentitalea sp. HM32M-2]|uniref:ligase-associated DNA damage response endonuclease PdeM n=1 Tax=Sedimentitalea sp. HM32M-2 TaxID=3351566 RepID=UPI0036385734